MADMTEMTHGVDWSALGSMTDKRVNGANGVNGMYGINGTNSANGTNGTKGISKPVYVLRIGKSRQEYYILNHHLPQSARWKTRTTSSPFVDLRDVHEEIGHLLAQYLSTGRYEPFEAVTLSAKYQQAILAACVAHSYDLEELSTLAQEDMMALEESQSVLEILQEAGIAFSKLPEDKTWFESLIVSKMKGALAQNRSKFCHDLSTHTPWKEEEFGRFLWRITMKILGEVVADEPRTYEDTHANEESLILQSPALQKKEGFSMNEHVTTHQTSVDSKNTVDVEKPVSHEDAMATDESLPKERILPSEEPTRPLFEHSPKVNTPTEEPLSDGWPEVADEVLSPVTKAAGPVESTSVPTEEKVKSYEDSAILSEETTSFQEPVTQEIASDPVPSKSKKGKKKKKATKVRRLSSIFEPESAPTPNNDGSVKSSSDSVVEPLTDVVRVATEPNYVDPVY